MGAAEQAPRAGEVRERPDSRYTATMPSTMDLRVEAAAARALTRLQRGESVGEMLRVFREDDGLGAIESILALRAIRPVGLASGKELVVAACNGRDFSHLGLVDLERLALLETLPGGPLGSHLRSAIISRHPWLLFERDVPGRVRYFTAPEPEPSRAGSISGDGVSFEALRARIIAARSDPRWAQEAEIVHDEPERLLIRFVNVAEQ